MATFAAAFAMFFALATLGHAQDGLTLRGDSVQGVFGQEVTVVFRVEGFWQITEGEGTIQWDSHVIDYVRAGDFGIPEIDAGTFTLIPEGMLTFQWNSDNELGNTLENGSILFSLTFGLHGEPGDSTSVAFSNGWTPLHFESAEEINLPFSSDAGGVSIVPEPSVVSLVVAGLLAFGLKRRSRSGR